MVTVTHLAAVAVVAMAWAWAGAQARYTWRDPSWWRVNTTAWLTAKALVITYLAVALWGHMTTMPHAPVLWAFAAVHAWVFAAWLRRPVDTLPRRDVLTLIRDER